jgi:hypothetical protein
MEKKKRMGTELGQHQRRDIPKCTQSQKGHTKKYQKRRAAPKESGTKKYRIKEGLLQRTIVPKDTKAKRITSKRLILKSTKDTTTALIARPLHNHTYIGIRYETRTITPRNQKLHNPNSLLI